MIHLVIAAHVAAGSLWLLISLAVAVTHRAPRPLLVAQLAAAFVALVAGITLWHALHAGPFGPPERLLVVGTFCAFIAMSFQIGLAVPILLGNAMPLFEAGGLLIVRLAAALLLSAAAAMTGSLYI